jgi:CheY-like chemotaxis protein
MALMLAGAHVRSASNAEEALELLRASVPAVIITDIRMPGHNGLWLLDQVRALPLSSAVPVIAYTGDVSLSD